MALRHEWGRPDHSEHPPYVILSAAKNLRCMNMNQYYVYILTNASRKLYTGVTNDVQRRVYKHKNKLVPGFTSKYNLAWLVYYEATNDVTAAISREKQIKGWLRKKKLALVASMNQQWQDLASDWYGVP